METYPEQFPGESQPDPSRTGPRTASLTPFKDSDGPGSTNHEGQPGPRSAGNGLHPMLMGVGRFGLQVKDIR